MLEKEFEKISSSCSTTLQRENLKKVISYVNWEVEVLDVRGWVLYATVQLYDPWSWWRGNEFDGKMDVTARLQADVPQEYLLKLNKGQRVWVKGPVTFLSRTFKIDPAMLVI